MAKTSSKHKKELYSAYKSQNRFAINRKRKLLKLQKQYPNNEQITAALNNIHYRRKKPKSQLFSKTKIHALSQNKAVSKIRDTNFQHVPVKVMFSLGSRAHTKGAQFSWSNI